MKHSNLLKSIILFFALALGSANAGAKVGDILAQLTNTAGNGYATRQTKTDSYGVGWVLSGSSSGVWGSNSNQKAKVKPTLADLPVVKGVTSSATTDTQYHYFYYTTTPVSNVGSVDFYFANTYDTSTSCNVYLVMGSAVSAANGDAYTQVELSNSSTTKQGASISSAGTYTFTFASTQTSAKYYGLVIKVASNSYKRFASASLTLKEGSTGPETFSVTYNANGATSGTVPTDATAYTSGATVTVKDNTGSLAKSGYTFGGWNTSADGTGTDRAVGSTFSITANTTLYAKWNAKTITGLSYEGTPTKTTYNAGENFNPAGLTVTATFDDSSSENVTASVTWTPSPLTQGTTSVTGTYMGRTINVTGLTVTTAPGTADNPYTVAQAISNTPSSGTSSDVYIHGKVSAFYGSNDDILDDSYHRYYISDDGTTSSQLLVFNGKGLDNATFDNVNDLLVGDEITLLGGLTTYNSTKEVAANNYIVSLVRKVATPSFSPVAGGVAENTVVTVSCSTSGATIYYTVNGSNPTTSSSHGDAGKSVTVTIDEAKTIKAFAVKDGCTDSDIATAEYTVLEPVETPTFSPAGGTYTWAQSVTLSCETDGATIFYTTNGNDPTTSSTAYTEAISVSETMTIKAIAAKYGMANSAVASATYTMNIPSISASNVNLAYSATSGSIAYSISNTVEGGVLTAAITAGNEGTWMSIGEVGETIPITCSANSSKTDDRTATVTLTYTYNTDETVTKDVVITQAKFVKDYADLPFSFDGGSSDIASKVGLTQYGLGSDYKNSPYLKFDGTGDYVILKINEAPGVLSFDIQGNSFSGGTFKVQTSADGTSYTDLKSYTSLGDTQSEEFSNLASTVRYIKWIYTTKSSGNVALGNISLAKDLPYIKLNSYSISVSDAEAEGTLTATYKGVEKEKSSDVEIHWFESDGETTASEPSWAIVSVNDAYNVEYLIEENTGVARSAYFKVYGLDAEAGNVYSSLVTISQAAFSGASLPFSFNGGRSDIASKTGFSQDGLGTDYASAPKLKFDGEGDYVLLHIDASPSVLSYDIKNNSFSGGTFTVQVSADGKTFNDFKVYTTINDTQKESYSLPSNVRYIKWVYTTKDTGNVGLGNISVTAFNPSAETITLGATLNNGRYWATFYNTSRYTLPAGAQAFTMNASNQLYLLGTNGSVIPAKTPVVVIADSASITLIKSDDETAIAVNGTSNILDGSDRDVLVSGVDGTPYVLGIKNGTLGFYKFVGTSIPAFKAYYIVK